MLNVFSEITILVLAALMFPMQTNWNFLALLLLLLLLSISFVAFLFDSSKDLNAPVSLIRGSKPVVSPEFLVSLMSRSSGERKKMNHKLLDVTYQMKGTKQEKEGMHELGA